MGKKGKRKKTTSLPSMVSQQLQQTLVTPPRVGVQMHKYAGGPKTYKDELIDLKPSYVYYFPYLGGNHVTRSLLQDFLDSGKNIKDARFKSVKDEISKIIKDGKSQPIIPLNSNPGSSTCGVVGNFSDYGDLMVAMHKEWKVNFFDLWYGPDSFKTGSKNYWGCWTASGDRAELFGRYAVEVYKKAVKAKINPYLLFTLSWRDGKGTAHNFLEDVMNYMTPFGKRPFHGVGIENRHRFAGLNSWPAIDDEYLRDKISFVNSQLGRLPGPGGPAIPDAPSSPVWITATNVQEWTPASGDCNDIHETLFQSIANYVTAIMTVDYVTENVGAVIVPMLASVNRSYACHSYLDVNENPLPVYEVVKSFSKGDTPPPPPPPDDPPGGGLPPRRDSPTKTVLVVLLDPPATIDGVTDRLTEHIRRNEGGGKGWFEVNKAIMSDIKSASDGQLNYKLHGNGIFQSLGNYIPAHSAQYVHGLENGAAWVEGDDICDGDGTWSGGGTKDCGSCPNGGDCYAYTAEEMYYIAKQGDKNAFGKSTTCCGCVGYPFQRPGGPPPDDIPPVDPLPPCDPPPGVALSAEYWGNDRACFLGNNLMDYNAFLTFLKVNGGLDIVALRNSGEIDELWIWGAPGMGFYEAVMMGRAEDTFPLNGGPIENNDFNPGKPLPVMGFNYANAGGSENNFNNAVGFALESYAHRIEGTMSHVYHNCQAFRSSPSAGNYFGSPWQRFIISACSDGWDDPVTRYCGALDPCCRNNPETYGCLPGSSDPLAAAVAVGMGHFPPNATGDYQFSEGVAVSSNYQEWAGPVSIVDTFETTATNCGTWGCGNRGFYKWNMTYMPDGPETHYWAVTGTQGAHSAPHADEGKGAWFYDNWWVYIRDPVAAVNAAPTNNCGYVNAPHCVAPPNPCQSYY
jgi:hypothetical protein